MLFIVYGQQKSASTYLANLTRQCCFAAGSDPDAVKRRLFTGPLEAKRKFWEGPLLPLQDVVRQMQPGEHTLVKTHSRFRPHYSKALKRPRIRVLISYRHPGDAALSAFEAGERARTENLDWPFFASLHSPREAIDAMAKLLDRATIPWLKSGLGTAFSYEQITGEPDTVLDALAQMLNLSADQLAQHQDLQDLLSGKTRVYNFNKGVSGRHREVFSPADLAYLEERCGRFIRFCDGEIGIEQV